MFPILLITAAYTQAQQLPFGAHLSHHALHANQHVYGQQIPLSDRNMFQFETLMCDVRVSNVVLI